MNVARYNERQHMTLETKSLLLANTSAPQALTVGQYWELLLNKEREKSKKLHTLCLSEPSTFKLKGQRMPISLICGDVV